MVSQGGKPPNKVQFINFSNIPLDININLGLPGPGVASGLNLNTSSQHPVHLCSTSFLGLEVPSGFKIPATFFVVAGCASFTEGNSSVVAFSHNLRLKERRFQSLWDPISPRPQVPRVSSV